MKRFIKTAVSAVYFAGRFACGQIARLVGVRRRPRLVILCYHAVPADHAQRFAAQMATLSRCSRVVSADIDIASLTAPATAITFDDAFASIAEHALPELARRQFRATVFVPAAVMGRAPQWRFDGASGDQLEVVMNAGQLRALDASLIDVGSHTLSHPRLPGLDDQTLESEIAGSRRELERELERPVMSLAFPHGAHDARSVEACRRAGYARVFSITPTPVHADNDGFVRGRITVEPGDSPTEFYLKVHGGYAWMPLASSIKRTVTNALSRHQAPPACAS